MSRSVRVQVALTFANAGLGRPWTKSGTRLQPAPAQGTAAGPSEKPLENFDLTDQHEREARWVAEDLQEDFDNHQRVLRRLVEESRECVHSPERKR